MDMFEAAANAFKSGGGAAAFAPPPAPAAAPAQDDLAALKDQMAALQAKLDRLGQ
jgi:polyhydroxyalkanoate synthesis regulator protein